MLNFKYDFYKVLGIPCFSLPKEIKRAYRRLALKHHPDCGGDEELMKLINLAYHTLTKQKADYDYWLKIKLGLIQPQLQPVVVQYYGYSDFGGTPTSAWTFTGGGTTNA